MNSSEFIWLQLCVGRLFIFSLEGLIALILSSSFLALASSSLHYHLKTPPQAALVMEASQLSHPFAPSSLLTHLLLFPSQGLFTSSSSHPSPAVSDLGISTFSHCCFLLSEFSLLSLESASSKVVPASFVYLLFIWMPFSDSLPSFWSSSPPPRYKSIYLILIFTVIVEAAGTGSATFRFDNFPWQTDSPGCFCFCFSALATAVLRPPPSSRPPPSEAALRKEAWPLLKAGDAKSKPLQKPLCALCCWAWFRRKL